MSTENSSAATNLRERAAFAVLQSRTLLKIDAFQAKMAALAATNSEVEIFCVSALVVDYLDRWVRPDDWSNAMFDGICQREKNLLPQRAQNLNAFTDTAAQLVAREESNGVISLPCPRSPQAIAAMEAAVEMTSPFGGAVIGNRYLPFMLRYAKINNEGPNG